MMSRPRRTSLPVISEVFKDDAFKRRKPRLDWRDPVPSQERRPSNFFNFDFWAKYGRNHGGGGGGGSGNDHRDGGGSGGSSGSNSSPPMPYKQSHHQMMQQHHGQSGPSVICIMPSPYDRMSVPSDANRPVVVQFVCPTPNNAEQGALSPAAGNRNSTASDTYDSVGPDNSLQTAGATCTTVSNTSSSTSLVKADGHLYPQLSGHAPSAPASPANGEVHRAGPPPTPEHLRKDIFRKNLTTMLSSIYAIFIVMLGGVVYVADVLMPYKNYGEVFTIYLTILGLAWLGFLHYDIRFFLNSISTWRKQEKRKAFARENPGFDKSMDSMSKPEVTLTSMDRSPGAPPLDSYCFKTGRHSGSFYLKIGAAVFCFGHLIHEGLLLSRQIVYFSSDEKYREQCADVIALILSILHPIFSFYQLFMVFKYSNIIINRYRELSRFAIMHIIGANLCLWVNTIIRETQEALAHKVAHGYAALHSNDTDDDDDEEGGATTPAAGLFKVAATMAGVKFDEESCVSSTILSSFTIQAAPYLYPFTIEYSLLLVGIWFIVWYNIGDTDAMEAEHQHHAATHPHDGEAGGDGGGSSSETFSSNLVIHVDCHSSNRGLFAGLFVLLATVVSVIIFFVAMTNEQYIQTGIVINNVSDTVLLLLMIFAAAFAYRQTARLDCNPSAITFLDDILLFIALPCFFLYAIFNVVASIAVNNPFNVVISVLCVIQVVIQTPFIVDGLRRCSNSCVLRYKKPGREIITFLVVCNVASWILETFEIKSYDAHSDRIEFYGSFLWTLLSHVTLPLTLFYRFHSSVCLVDMWKSAYEPGDAH